MTTISIARRDIAPWIVWLARAGYASKGLVYGTIGFLAVAASFGLKGDGSPDRRDALSLLAEKPYGKPILILITVGLLGYAIWRVCSSITDSEHRGRNPKGIAIRIGEFVRGALYAMVAFELTRWITRGEALKSSDAEAQHWTARGMNMPFGRWIVAASGVILIGYALWQLYRALRGKLSRQLFLPSDAMRNVARFGLGSRAAVFIVIGWSVLVSALRHNPGHARGTSGAIQDIGRQPFGIYLLVIVGLGLAAYGVYAFLNARYRRIQAV